MALASEPKLLMLDEPASGLSRGERQVLTDLLLGLDREITLILIEHDMDVALRVAEHVTMMHDGRVIVEGHARRRFGRTRSCTISISAAAHYGAESVGKPRFSRSPASTPTTAARRPCMT